MRKVLLFALLLVALPGMGGAQGISYYPNTRTLAVGTSTASISGLLHLNSTTVTPAGTSEEVVYTYTIPAGTWAVGRMMRVFALATTAANTNAKSLRVRFGASGAGASGTLISAMAGVTTSGTTIGIDCTIVNASASAQRAFVRGSFGTDYLATTYATAAIDSTAATEITVTLQNAIANTDASGVLFWVEVLN